MPAKAILTPCINLAPFKHNENILQIQLMREYLLRRLLLIPPTLPGIMVVVFVITRFNRPEHQRNPYGLFPPH